MTPLVLAVLVFIAAHSLPASPPVRAALIRRIGKPAYMLAYSALSLLLIVWIGVAYRQAPYIGLWGPDPRLHWVPLLGMPVVCLLVSAGLATPNPLSLTLRRSASGQTGQTGLTTQVPPLLRLSRHPVLLGLALWAGLHGVANGDVASLILFGLMGGLALGGMAMMDLRRRRRLGDAVWLPLAAAAPRLNLLALPSALRPRRPLLLALLAAALLYGLLLHAHQPVIGVSPLPW